MKRLLVALAAVAACGGSQAPPGFTLADARVDPTYTCPAGSTEARYDVHATIQAHNATARGVTIQSATADLQLVAVTGRWLEKVGDRYSAGAVKVSPSNVPPGSTTTLEVTIPSACTSGRNPSAHASSGAYKVTIYIATSTGAYSVEAANRHEIVAN